MAEFITEEEIEADIQLWLEEQATIGLTEAEALRDHTEWMKNPTYRQSYIQDTTPGVRLCYATGHYTPTDLAVLFDLSVSDIERILRECG